MNFLAHIFLARHSDRAMLGALLGDFVRPQDTRLYHSEIQSDILLHRKIDSYTDSHPAVLEAKSLFRSQQRRYAGILLDIFYDHVLSLHWSDYAQEPRKELIQRFYAALLEQEKQVLPATLQAALPRMISQDWLGSYSEFKGVEIAVERTSKRLSRNGHLLLAGLDDLRDNYLALSKGFHVFFPDLIEYVRERRQQVGWPDRIADIH